MNEETHNEIYHRCKGWHHWDLAGKYALLGNDQALQHLEVAEFHFAIAGEDEKKILKHIQMITNTYFENKTTNRIRRIHRKKESSENFTSEDFTGEDFTN